MEYGRRFVISMVMALVFLALAGCQSGSVKPRTPGTLRVLTYNIHHGEAMDKQFDYQRLAKVINDLSPDIVALQEVDVGTERAGGRRSGGPAGQAVQDAPRLWPSHAATRAGSTARRFCPGSRLRRCWSIRCPTNSSRSRGPPWKCGSSRTASGQLPSSARTCAIRRSRTAFSRPSGSAGCSPKQEDCAVILAGDFNARPGSEPMKVLLDAGWIDAVAPRSVIDYVLVRSCDAWKVKEVTILDEPVVSDHDPVLVVLGVARPFVVTRVDMSSPSLWSYRSWRPRTTTGSAASEGKLALRRARHEPASRLIRDLRCCRGRRLSCRSRCW